MKLKEFCAKHATVLITYLIAALLLIFVSIMRPGYASPNNLVILGAQAGILGIAALGQTFVILTGGMDLSIPWMLTISSFLVSILTGGSNASLTYAIPLILGCGALMGAVNGFGVAYIGIAPVIMTMATNIIYQGLLVGLTGGTPGGAPPSALEEFALADVGGFSNLFLLWVALSVIAMVVLRLMPFGRKIYAVGNSTRITRFSGINEKRVVMLSYVVCGVTAAIAGIIYAGRLGQMYLGMGDTYQMQSISSVAIGGIALIGGSGSYMGTVAGVLILTILNGVLSALSIPQSVQKIIYGFVLLAAVLISTRRKAGGAKSKALA